MVWRSAEKEWKLQWDNYEKLGGYHACGTTHEANSTDKFLDGYYIMKGSDRPQNVIVWRGPKGDNTHCTTNLNMKEWATAKS